MNIPIKNKILTGFESLGIKPALAAKVQPHFIPLQTSKYITMSLDKDCNGEIYPFFQEVIDLLCPFLAENGIDIVDVTLEKSEAQNFTYIPETELDINRVAWVLERSLLHFGGHGWIDAAFASLSDSPIVSVTNTPEFENPIKPSVYFDFDEKVENIAQKILSLLGIDEKVNTETLIVGPLYEQRIVDIIPTKEFSVTLPQNAVTVIRLDVTRNYDIAAAFLEKIPHAVITIDADIPEEHLAPFLKCKNFKIHLTPEITTEFLSRLQNLGINYMLNVFESKDQWVLEKTKFFDFNPPAFIETVSKKELEVEHGIKYTTKVRSRKVIVDHAGDYVSLYHRRKGFVVGKDKGITVANALNDPSFLREVNHFMFYDYKSTN